MNILLYNPDNEATNNFMPHLGMFLLKSLTPLPHEVILPDGNARRRSEVVNELLALKALARQQKGEIAVFFVDDNFAINPPRTKSLLHKIIAHNAQIPWVAQISMNLLRDEELLCLIAQSGGKWIFMGLESIDPENLKSVSKGFNKPAEYNSVLERLSRHNLYAITSFIFGMDGDRPGAAERTLEQIRSWPPVLPVFGLLTPYPATPLYDKLAAAGRLTRPRHWLDFKLFVMAHSPLGLSAEPSEAEVRQAREASYSPRAMTSALERLKDKPIADRITRLCSRRAFRGIYFPHLRRRDLARLVFENRGPIFAIVALALMAQFKLHPAAELRHAESDEMQLVSDGPRRETLFPGR